MHKSIRDCFYYYFLSSSNELGSSQIKWQITSKDQLLTTISIHRIHPRTAPDRQVSLLRSHHFLLAPHPLVYTTSNHIQGLLVPCPLLYTTSNPILPLSTLSHSQLLRLHLHVITPYSRRHVPHLLVSMPGPQQIYSLLVSMPKPLQVHNLLVSMPNHPQVHHP